MFVHVYITYDVMRYLHIYTFAHAAWEQEHINSADLRITYVTYERVMTHIHESHEISVRTPLLKAKLRSPQIAATPYPPPKLYLPPKLPLLTSGP